VARSGLSCGELDAIAASSARNNAALGLTGILVHQGRCFGGVLEGPRRAVFERMEAIAVDPRHEEVRILREKAIRRRRFDNWSFAALPAPAPRPDTQAGGSADTFIASLARRLT
jgi:Sensors of blue-light using FAD